MLRAVLVGRDERQVDVGLGLERQVLLGLLGRLLEPLQGHLVLAEVDALLLLELVGDVIDQRLVPVVAAQVGVAVGREHLEDAVGHVEDRDVERAAAQVEDGDLLVLLLVEAVGQRRGGRLVDDPRDLQAGDLAGVLGRLPLAVVEIGRDGDDRLADLVPEVALGRLLELAQDECRDLRRGVLLAVDPHLDEVVGAADDLVGDHLLLGLDLAVAAAHEPLDRVDRPLGIGDGLPLGRLADEDFSLAGEGDDRGGQPASFLVGDDRHVATLHHRDDAVGRPQVDADDLLTFCHDGPPFGTPTWTRESATTLAGRNVCARRRGPGHVPRAGRSRHRDRPSRDRRICQVRRAATAPIGSARWRAVRDSVATSSAAGSPGR